MRKRLGAIVLGLVLVGLGAHAPSRAAAQAQPSAQELHLRAGRARLDFLAGEWRVEQFAPAGAEAWRSNGGSDLRVTPTMNDLYLETNASSGNYLYHIVFSFDVVQQQYRVISRDNQSGLIDVYEGVFDEGGTLTVSNVGPGTHYVVDGARYFNRMKFSPSQEGWIWLVEASDDFGQSWRPQVRVIARR